MKAEYRKDCLQRDRKDMQECRVLELGTTEKETMQRKTRKGRLRCVSLPLRVKRLKHYGI